MNDNENDVMKLSETSNFFLLALSSIVLVLGSIVTTARISFSQPILGDFPKSSVATQEKFNTRGDASLWKHS